MGIEKKSRVLDAATTVFLRYGYRRTTMGDIATAAGISRPALYLLFCNKERIFEGVVQRLADGTLDEIRAGLAGLESPLEQLRFAFELWAVRPFALVEGSPDARDLVNCSLEFAKGAVDQGCAAFEAELVSILQVIRGSRPDRRLDSARIAHILTAAVRGFKASAHSSEELRGMIDGLLTITLDA